MVNQLRNVRRTHVSKRRGNRPIRLEQLEPRFAMAVLEFDTALTSLNLSGGPYPMPLASDPANLLGDSIEGYGFVNSSVSITLSSQRSSSPGPASLGTACAFPIGGPQSGPIGVDHACRGSNGTPGNPGTDEPIDPNHLDGQQFFVQSFFDVFFDITVTDVDPRPGRDFPGMPDGASIVLPNNGPANMQSNYEVVFDKNAPNYGLIPPPQVSPYIGHFLIEIPLGGDINGNGEPDKIKFTVASHAAGDGNRSFVQLPNGTMLDEFDSAAFLEGAIVDESTDPPFTLGAGSSGAPAFSGPGGLTGPTTASSTLLNPVLNADFSFVDVDRDKLFAAGIDLMLDDEVADGMFDTDVPEGDYATAIPGAGLYLGGAPISAPELRLAADGNLVVNTDLTATARFLRHHRFGGGDVHLTSRAGQVRLDDPTVSAFRDVRILAATSIVSTMDPINAGRDVYLSAPFIRVEAALVQAGRDIRFIARDAIDVQFLTLKAGRDVQLKGGGDLNLDNAFLTAGRSVCVVAGGEASLLSTTVKARKEIYVEADAVYQGTATTFMARKVKIKVRNP